MKNVYFLFLLSLLLTIPAAAQKTDGDKSKLSSDLLPDKAFDKMVIQDITYAIFGEQTPVSGIKIDISKPEATLSGFFAAKKPRPWLFGLEFKGGITDKSWSIFKGVNSFNTAFEARPTVHWIPGINTANYYTANKPFLLTKNDQVAAIFGAIPDSFYSVTLIYNQYLTNFTDMQDNKSIPSTYLTGITNPQKDLLIYFIKHFTKSADPSLVNTNDVNTLLKVVKPATATGVNQDRVDPASIIDGLAESYTKYKKLFRDREQSMFSKQIENVSKAWSRKNYYWFTGAPLFRTDKITEYHTKFEGRDSFYFKTNYPFYYGATVWFNNYILWPKKVALFWRAGVTLSRANNIAILSPYNYETRSPLFSYGNAVTEKTKSGAAYNFDDLDSRFAFQATGEIYLLPINAFIPGPYLSVSLNNSKLYRLPNFLERKDDKTVVPIEGGLVFNINSREKDKEKNILSISGYYRFEDLTDSRRTSIKTMEKETREDFIKRNRTMGIKVGIPINLPQRDRTE